ncbi:MAG: hypothetical protein KAQ94_02770 [Arcobacteraceae bacterium]|nr:hypothetical protein [Arcobacteraceae bacterium]
MDDISRELLLIQKEYNIADNDPVFAIFKALDKTNIGLITAIAEAQKFQDMNLVINKQLEINILKLETVKDKMYENISKDIFENIEADIIGFQKDIQEIKNQTLGEIESSKKFILKTNEYIQSLPDTQTTIYKISNDIKNMSEPGTNIAILIAISLINTLGLSFWLFYYFIVLGA